MQAISVRGGLCALAVTGLVGIGAIALSGTASAEQERAGGAPATIKAKAEGRTLDWFGPETIERGAELTIVNKTSPREIGPHTFTLVRKGKKPFRRIQNAHEVGGPPNFEVGKRVVHSGKHGWDRAFTKHHDGDSWYVDKRGNSHSRRVKAHVGKTVRYFCAIHTFMKGKFEVTG